MKSVLIYTKTHCPYSLKAKALLSRKGIPFEERDIEQHPERREEMVKASQGRTSVPQVVIGGEWIGGGEDLQRLEHEGRLDELVQDGALAQV